MISDVRAMIWKEFHELRQGGGRGKYAPIILVLIYGVVFPSQAGRSWVDSYQMIGFGLGISVFIVLSVVADSIAGERERHTLETLLASRLSDRSILVGKIASVVIYGWGLTIASLLVGLIVVNVSAGDGKLLLYPAGRAIATVVLTFLLCVLATGIGVLVSLRSSTVRQAQQMLTIGWIVMIFGIVFGVQLMSPATRLHLEHRLSTTQMTTAVIVASLVLLVLDLLVLALNAARFQRSRLILD
ncbi:MAG TPA: ABC transporter permease [Nitrolancea sp.]|jgi:ABC-2 type transport system permease protein|nr:ABC transporter permease [Nitrolancea sp.]